MKNIQLNDRSASILDKLSKTYQLEPQFILTLIIDEFMNLLLEPAKNNETEIINGNVVYNYIPNTKSVDAEFLDSIMRDTRNQFVTSINDLSDSEVDTYEILLDNLSTLIRYAEGDKNIKMFSYNEFKLKMEQWKQTQEILKELREANEQDELELIKLEARKKELSEEKAKIQEKLSLKK